MLKNIPKILWALLGTVALVLTGVFGTTPASATSLPPVTNWYVDCETQELAIELPLSTYDITYDVHVVGPATSDHLFISNPMNTSGAFAYVQMANFGVDAVGEGVDVTITAEFGTPVNSEVVGAFRAEACAPVAVVLGYDCDADLMNWSVQNAPIGMRYDVIVDGVWVRRFTISDVNSTLSLPMQDAVDEGVVRSTANEVHLERWPNTVLLGGASYVFSSENCNGTDPTPTPTPTPTVDPTPTPTPTPTVEPPPPVLADQTLKAPAKVLKRGKTAKLAKATHQGAKVKWQSKTSKKVCVVKAGKLVAGKKKGSCRLTATAAAVPSFKTYTGKFTVKVK